MTETGNLHLKKPSQEDFYDVDDFNLNADLIDAKIGDMATQLAHKVDTNEVAQPNGIATLNSSGKLAQMPTAEDIAAIPLSQKGIANGIATLNGSGKLAQMPTAADVGAEPKLIVTDYSKQVVEMNGFKSYLIVKKMGHLVVVKNYIDKGSGTYSTSGARVATLPAAVAPSNILYFASTAYNFDGGEYAARVTISANGLVMTYAPADATIAIIDAVYLV